MCVRFSRFIPLKQSIFLPFKKWTTPTSSCVRPCKISRNSFPTKVCLYSLVAVLPWYELENTNRNEFTFAWGGGILNSFPGGFSTVFRGKLLGHPLIHGRKEKPPDICFYSCDSNNELIKSCGDCRDCERCIHGILGGKRVSLWGARVSFSLFFFSLYVAVYFTFICY